MERTIPPHVHRLVHALHDAARAGQQSWVASCPCAPNGDHLLFLDVLPSGLVILNCEEKCPQARVLAALGLTEQALRPDATPLDDGSAGTDTTSTEYEDAQADDDLEPMAPIGADPLDGLGDVVAMADREQDRAASTQESPPEYDLPDLAIYEAEGGDPEGHEEAGAGDTPPATRVSSSADAVPVPVVAMLDGVELPRPLAPVHVDHEIPCLPGISGELVDALVDVTQAPQGLVVQAVLAAQALICQADTVVVLPDGRQRPPSLLLATLAGPEERGAEVHERLRAPIHAYLRDVQGDATRQPEAGAVALPELLTMLPTRTEVTRALRDGGRSFGLLVSDGIDERAARRSTSSIWAGSLLADLTRGGPITDVTTRGHRQVIHDPRLAMHIVVQPDVAASLIDADHLHELLLVCAPRPTTGASRWRAPTPSALRVLEQHDRRTEAALSRIGSARRTLHLSPDAMARYTEYYDRVEAAAREEGEYGTIAALAVRLPEHATRIGAVLAIAEDADVREIGLGHLEVAIRLCEHYAAVARQLRVGPHYAQRLLDWIRENWDAPLISAPDVYQRGPLPTRPKVRAVKALAILEDHGWLVRAPGGHEVLGERREVVYAIRHPDGSWRQAS